VPTKNRVRRDNRRHLRQQPTTEMHTEDSQAQAFVVSETQPLTAELRLEEPVLFAEESITVCCSRWPMTNAVSEHMQRNHAPSLRQLGGVFGLLGGTAVR
jgi:hypothetical protein